MLQVNWHDSQIISRFSKRRIDSDRGSRRKSKRSIYKLNVTTSLNLKLIIHGISWRVDDWLDNDSEDLHMKEKNLVHSSV